MRYRQNIYYCPVAIALCDGTGKKYKGVNEDQECGGVFFDAVGTIDSLANASISFCK